MVLLSPPRAVKVPVTMAQEVLSLPVYPELTDAQMEAVVTRISEFYSGR